MFCFEDNSMLHPNLQSFIHGENREVFAASKEGKEDKGTPAENEGAEEKGVLTDTSHLMERDAWDELYKNWSSGKTDSQ